VSLVDALIAEADFFADPYPAYATLRAEEPVAWSERWGGWVVTRYSDVAVMLRDAKRFSSAGRVQYILDKLPAAARSRTALLEAHYRVGIAHMDPPDHTRLRALLAPWFTPRHMEALRPRIRLLAAELVEQAFVRAQVNDGRVDLMRDLAYPLPAIVVLELLGAPAGDAELLRNWALQINLLFSGGGRAPQEQVEQAQAALATMRDYIGALVAERRRQPSDDLIGRLVATEGDRLDDNELISTCVTLFVAGHETTTNLIGNGLVALLRHPAALRQLQAEPARMGSAVEEMLRYDAPVHRSWRIATEAVTLHGRRILPGDMVLLMIGAAHRDPAAFAKPEVFDITRSDNRHMGFGLGIHFCLGAPLARIEAPEAIHALLARTGGRADALTLIEEPPLRWRHDVALRGVAELPVEVRL
jgi:cytochrome P450